MPRPYTCSNCRHAGVLDVPEKSSEIAEGTCPQCGGRVDTLSGANTAEITEGPGAPADKTAVHPAPAGPFDQTIVWKENSTTLLIPGYEILRELGRGGMGVVYQAREEKLNRVVALKMILSGSCSSADQLARFQTEAQAVAQLHHPNIVQIFAVGEFEGRPYCAFEYVDGGSLSNKILRNAQPSRDSAMLIESLARAIHLAHQRGIVHRDLKPDNILLTADGTPKISDFGLAKRLESDAGNTQTGSILGTPAYMAPEQAAGKSKEVGPAADIWALGAILYHLLTGQSPFQGPTMLDTVQMVRTIDPVAPSRLRPKLQRDLETICLKCLEKDPYRRYPSAEALADDLRRHLNNEPILARPAGTLEHVIRFIKRRPSTVGLVAMLVVIGALLCGSLVWIWQTDSARHQAQQGNKPYELNIPKGLPSLSLPGDNPLTEGRVELGKQLFFDKRLSADGTVSCATCHDPSKGWSDGKAVSAGMRGQVGGRNSLTIVNSAYQTFLFWDGRAGSLEEQALSPIQNSVEMGMPSLDELQARLNKVDGYRSQFKKVFGTEVTAENVGKALAAFQRTILAGNAPYDRYKAGDTDALSEPAQRGMKLFAHKAHCAACHSGPNFSDGAFHNIGIGINDRNPDIGRQKITGILGDRGSFRTPSLREISRTAPYMHDGSLKTLEEVVDFYVRGGVKNPQLDEEIYPLKLTNQEKRDLVTFLREGLTGTAYPFVAPPKLPD